MEAMPWQREISKSNCSILDSIMGFKPYLVHKMRDLIRVYYKLYSNKADYLKTFWTS